MPDGAGRRQDHSDNEQIAIYYTRKITPDVREELETMLGGKGLELRVESPPSGIPDPSLQVRGMLYKGERSVAGYFGETSRR